MNQCILCFSQSKQILINRTDYEYATSVKLKYWECENPNCKLVFADPIPSFDEIKKLYFDYSTHYKNTIHKFMNPVSYITRHALKKYYFKILNDTSSNDFKILDYGCGNGNLLALFKELKKNNLFGYDFDEKAIAIAKKNGFSVFDNIESIKKNSPYDKIFINHVIEHLIDAKNELDNLYDLLSPNGQIYVRTPNSNSILRHIFTDDWRGWETPRHFRIYNSNNIKFISSRFFIEKIWTSNLMFTGAFHKSFIYKFPRKKYLIKVFRHFLLPILFIYSYFINLIENKYGDELCIILRK